MEKLFPIISKRNDIHWPAQTLSRSLPVLKTYIQSEWGLSLSLWKQWKKISKQVILIQAFIANS